MKIKTKKKYLKRKKCRKTQVHTNPLTEPACVLAKLSLCPLLNSAPQLYKLRPLWEWGDIISGSFCQDLNSVPPDQKAGINPQSQEAIQTNSENTLTVCAVCN